MRIALSKLGVEEVVFSGWILLKFFFSFESWEGGLTHTEQNGQPYILLMGIGLEYTNAKCFAALPKWTQS